ncbi:PREDICTED: coiled-coil domain-containing protein 177-like [Priapulus caudatus]|uniref:Coiled-coil domain-containing protein 177-like n=1 Tax=Priapulus caudatus TaxID=37621 RepID=A0ABM1DN49_PRICU|nr:PREDICTED: coiled-coil domain-containing protein 177-like [Priapulus caudatus]
MRVTLLNTSPRSLEACERIGARPVQLLHKSIDEFVQELTAEGLTLPAIYKRYEQYEKTRAVTLNKCKKLRYQIIDEELSDQPRTDKSEKTAKNNVAMSRGRIDKSTEKKGVVSRDHSTAEKIKAGGLHNEKNRSIAQKDMDAMEYNQGDYQSDDSLEVRNMNSHKVSGQLQQISRQAKIQNPRSQAKIIGYSRTGQHRPKSTTNTASGKETEESETASQRSMVSSKPTAHSLRKVSYNMPKHARPRSVAGGARAPLNNYMTRSTPNFSLPRRIRGAKGATMSEQDRKILTLMISRGEEEVALADIQERAHRTWEEDARLQQLMRMHAEEAHRLDMPLHSHAQRRNQHAVAARKHLTEHCQREERLQQSEHSHQKWQAMSEMQKELKTRQLLLSSMKGEQKRLQQEERLQEMREAEERYLSELRHAWQEDLDTACAKKASLTKANILGKQAANHANEHFHHHLKASADIHFIEGIAALESHVEEKHAKAKERQMAVQWNTVNRIRHKSLEKEMKMHRSRERLNMIEDDQQQWREHLLSLSSQKEQEAAMRANTAIEARRFKAMEQRRRKDLEHKVLLSRVKRHDEMWKEQVRHQIIEKELKIESLQKEKAFTQEEKRAIAHSMSALRESIQVRSESFDRKLRQAEHNARITLQSPSIQNVARNLSTLTIG